MLLSINFNIPKSHGPKIPSKVAVPPLGEGWTQGGIGQGGGEVLNSLMPHAVSSSLKKGRGRGEQQVGN